MMLFFFPFYLLFWKQDIIPWLLYKGNKIKFTGIPSQKIHTELNYFFLVTK